MTTTVTVESGNVVTVGLVTSPTIFELGVGSGVQGPPGLQGPPGPPGPQGPASSVVYDGGTPTTDFSVGLSINCGGVT